MERSLTETSGLTRKLAVICLQYPAPSTLGLRMSSFRIRPRFVQTVELNPDATRARILQAFAENSPDIEVRGFSGFIGLHIAENNRHVWSPRLLLDLKSNEFGKTTIEGVYGPESDIWSVYLYGYLITGLLGTFSGALGWAQIVIGTPPWGLWVLATMSLLAGGLYLAAQFGQKLGAWQTFQLHQAYQTAIGQPTELH